MHASPLTPPLANRRHDLDPEAIAQEISRKVARMKADGLRRVEHAESLQTQYAQDVEAGVAQRRWVRKPWSPDGVHQFFEDNIRFEQTHYAKVRVIELPQEGPRFLLVYGDTDDATVSHGTGPFETLEKAAAWFFSGGR